MEALLFKYGYVLLFVGVAVEGEAFLLAAAVLVQRGYFSLGIVIAVAIAANTLADGLYYYAARFRGRRWLEGRFGGNRHFQRVADLITRRAPLLIVASRFAFGFRILIPAACGAFGVPWIRFLPLVVVASALWAVPTALAGYYAGGALGALLQDLRHHEVLIAAAIVLVPAAGFGVRAIRALFGRRALAFTDLHALVPLAIGLMGVLNLLSAILPRTPQAIVALESWLPLEVVQRSRPAMLFAGVALLQVTRSLSRYKALAWWVAAGALLVSLVSHIGRALDLHHSLIAALLLAYLVVFRRRFQARSDPASLQRAFLAAPILAGLVVVYGVVGLDDLHDEYDWSQGGSVIGESLRVGVLTAEPTAEPTTPHAERFTGSLQIAGWLARLYLLLLVLRAVVQRDRLEAPADIVRTLAADHTRNSLSAFAVQNDKHHLLVASGRGLVAYAVRRAVAFACGDPLAPDEAFELSVAEYLAHCRRNDWTPCVYEAAEDRLPVYRKLGCRDLKIAEEAILDLSSFSLAGGKRAALRALVHKVQKLGLRVVPYDREREPEPEIDEQLEEISEEWLAEKRLAEMGFTVGRFSLEGLNGSHVFLCLSGERIEAFCTWLPYAGGRAAVIDLMRKRREAVSGTMDLLLSSALLTLKERGLETASLANAPLANVGGPRTHLDRGVALLFENMNSIYGYKSLFQFKKKFAPHWEGRYLVYPRGSNLARIAMAVTQVHGSGGLLRLAFGR